MNPFHQKHVFIKSFLKENKLAPEEVLYVGDEVQGQLEAHAASPHVETIIFSGADVHLLAGDLNHAIVKRGCRDEDIINLSDRFDYINDTSDGSLDRWC